MKIYDAHKNLQLLASTHLIPDSIDEIWESQWVQGKMLSWMLSMKNKLFRLTDLIHDSVYTHYRFSVNFKIYTLRPAVTERSLRTIVYRALNDDTR